MLAVHLISSDRDATELHLMTQLAPYFKAKKKELCKWKQDDIKKNIDDFSDIVRNPKFVCKKCGRVADKKKWLHKPAIL